MQTKTLYRDQYRTFYDLHKGFEDGWMFIKFYSLTNAVDDGAQPWETNLTTAADLNIMDKRFKKWKDHYRNNWDDVKCVLLNSGKRLGTATGNAFAISHPEYTLENCSPAIQMPSTSTNGSGSNLSINSASSTSTNNSPPSLHDSPPQSSSIRIPSPATVHTNSSASSLSLSVPINSTPVASVAGSSYVSSSVLSVSASGFIDPSKKKCTNIRTETWVNFLNTPKYDFVIEDDKTWNMIAKPPIIDAVQQVNQLRAQVDLLNTSLESKFQTIKGGIESYAKGMNEQRNLHFLLLWLQIENKLMIPTQEDKIYIFQLRSHITTFKNDFEKAAQLLTEMLREKEKLETLCNVVERERLNPEWKSYFTLAKDIKPNGWQKVTHSGSISDGLSSSPALSAFTWGRTQTNSKGVAVVREGYMKKQGEKVKGWKTRYFVLSADKLLAYYSSGRKSSAISLHSSGSAKSPHGKMKGSIDVGSSNSILATKVDDTKTREGQPHVIEITTPKRVWRLSCETQQDLDEWLKLLRDVMMS